MGNPETVIQNDIRGNLTPAFPGSIFFRNETGYDRERKVFYGLCKGSGDIIGIMPIMITPSMIGKTFGVFASFEDKTIGKKLTKGQGKFLKAIDRAGGISAVFYYNSESEKNRVVGVANRSQLFVNDDYLEYIAGKCEDIKQETRDYVSGKISSCRYKEKIFRNETGFDKTGKVPYGLCKGSADNIAIIPITISARLIGRTIGVFTSIEVKTPEAIKKKNSGMSPEQVGFYNMVKEQKGIAVVASSVEEAIIGIKRA